MKNKNALLCLIAGAGGGIMGFCASRLDTAAGTMLFAAGAGVLVFSLLAVIRDRQRKR